MQWNSARALDGFQLHQHSLGPISCLGQRKMILNIFKIFIDTIYIYSLNWELSILHSFNDQTVIGAFDFYEPKEFCSMTRQANIAYSNVRSENSSHHGKKNMLRTERKLASIADRGGMC